MLLNFLQTICDWIRAVTWNTVSPEYLFAAIVLFCLLLLGGLPLVRRKKLSPLQLAALCALITYLFLIFGATVFCRPTRKKYALQLRPFWSYYQIFVLHKKKMPGMILRNILMLFPLGLLFPACTGGRSGAWKQLIPLSLGISYGIELLQLLLRRGTFELVDDPFHNLLGAFLGCGVYCLLLRLTGKGRNAGQKTG